MELLLALLSGIICTIMIAWNGELSNVMGIYASTVIVHAMGFITMLLLFRFKKIKITLRNGLPLYLYTGGVIGVFTVFFNSYTILTIGASLVSALGLLGQICTSLLLEQKGWLGSIQSSISWEKMLSVAIILLGIGVMLL